MLSNSELEQEIKKGFDRIRGRLLGLIESYGLNEKHERAAVSTLKALSYDLQSDLIKKLTK
jgi:hypothetical protein